MDIGTVLISIIVGIAIAIVSVLLFHVYYEISRR